MTRLSIIVPVLNEAATLPAALARLAPLRARGVEVVVADGGSSDETAEVALPLADRVVRSPRGRGRQMNEGAAAATGDVLLFLHADTVIPHPAAEHLGELLRQSGRAWGRFDVRIEGRSPLLPAIAAMMNVRSRLTGIATGDQAIFVRREAFVRAGGYPDIPLMEDIALSRALKRGSPPLCLRERVVTSGRRWDRHGALRTIALMWRLRFAYWRGASPAALARRYGYVPRDD